MAQQDQWGQGPSPGDDKAILRLEAALSRIAAAAGRKQDELRVAELNARAAQHEADLLLQAREEREQLLEQARTEERDERHRQDVAEVLEAADRQAAQQQNEMRALAARLDELIAMVRDAVPELDEDGSRSGPDAGPVEEE